MSNPLGSLVIANDAVKTVDCALTAIGELQSCGRVAEGYVIPGVHSLGGTYQPDIGDVMTCYRTCAASSDCAAVDFDAGDNSCWFHAGPASCGRVEAAPSTLQIRRRRNCSPPPPPS